MVVEEVEHDVKRHESIEREEWHQIPQERRAVYGAMRERRRAIKGAAQVKPDVNNLL